MERVKKAGGNLSNGYWGERFGDEAQEPVVDNVKEIKMTKDGLKKLITIDELGQHDKEDNPWFVVNGEVYDGAAFLEGHPGGAQSNISATALDNSDEFMAIRKLDQQDMYEQLLTLEQTARMRKP